MKKGTKKIRKVSTGANEYYVYDLDPTADGTRRRLYARTEQELLDKIEKAKNEEKIVNEYYAPNISEKFGVFIKFYLRCNVGKLYPTFLKQDLELANTAIFDSEIDIPLKDLSKDIINVFFIRISATYSLQALEKIKKIIVNTINNAKNYGIEKNIEEKDIIIPNVVERNNDYIISSAQYDRIIKIVTSSLRNTYGNNINIIILCLYTGIMPRYLLNLKEKDLDLENNIIKVYYGEKAIDVEISDETVNFLKDYLFEKNIRRQQDNPEELLFMHEGKMPYYPNLNITLNRLAVRMGLQKGITFKALQKAYIIRELKRGVPKSVLSKNTNVSISKILQIEISLSLQDDLF